MNDTNTRSGADEPCNSAGAEHCANIGTGEKPAPGKRETPPAEKSRADALTDRRVQEIAEKFGITTANVRAFVDACATSPVEQPAAAPIDDCDDVHELAYEMCLNKDSSSRTGTFEFASEDLFAFVRNAAVLMARTAPAPSPADERAAFEAKFPIPHGIKWDGEKYVVCDGYENSYRADRFVGQWAAWQARAASANETVAEGIDALAHEVWSAAQLVPGEGIEDGVRHVAAILSRSPAMAAEAVDWRELSRRLYVELFNCDQQMRSTRDEDGEPHWTQSSVVRDVLADAKAALDRTPAQAAEAVAIPAGYAFVPIEPTPEILMAIWQNERDARRAWERALAAVPQPAQADARIDVEAMLRACVPGGNICDPQRIADSIREWFSERNTQANAQVGLTDSQVHAAIKHAEKEVMKMAPFSSMEERRFAFCRALLQGANHA